MNIMIINVEKESFLNAGLKYCVKDVDSGYEFAVFRDKFDAEQYIKYKDWIGCNLDLNKLEKQLDDALENTTAEEFKAMMKNEETQSPAAVFCPHCNFVMPPNYNYCGNCGFGKDGYPAKIIQVNKDSTLAPYMPLVVTPVLLKELYLISKLWINPEETGLTTGYEPHLFVESEEDAKRMCENNKEFIYQKIYLHIK